MFHSISDRPLTAVIAATLVAATLVAGFAVLLMLVAPGALAGGQVDAAVHAPLAKGDRLAVIAKGTACSLRAWPHYETGCQFDMRRPASQPRTVRVIALR